MRRRACALAFALATMASAHRLDEYLQLTALSLEPGRVRATLYLTPGVAVAKRVIALIDTNGDGLLSSVERRAYAMRVARDLVLSVDGVPRPFRVVSATFPTVDAIRQGVGTVEIALQATRPSAAGPHALAFENRHERPVAAYLVECLAPDRPTVRIVSQRRSPEQARYALRYVQAKA